MAKPAVLLILLHSLCVSIVALPYIQSGCQYEGRSYKEGQDVRPADPCVKCSCVRGSLVCRLRVCAPQPHPPPPGCWLLRRRNDCCHKLVCSRELESGRSGSRVQIPESGAVKDGCVVNGTVYGEGSAMDSSSHCQYCYCIKGQQHCVRPECLLTEPGCSPVYNSESCCPTKYNCSAATSNISTTTPSVLEHGCLVNGKYYPEGEMIMLLRNNCENCYCMKNKVRCEPVICSVPLNQKCTPVITNGHCCPTSYNCNPEEADTLSGIDRKKQEMYSTNATRIAPSASHGNKYLNSAAYSERSITDSSVLSMGNTTLSTISKLDTQNTLQTNESISTSEISNKNKTVSKPNAGNMTSKPAPENTLLKLSTDNTPVLTKPSTESTALSNQTTVYNTTISTLNTKNAAVSKPVPKNPTIVSKQPSMKNTTTSKPSAENTTFSKLNTKNVTLSKPSSENTTNLKSSSENITVSKPSTGSKTTSKLSTENVTISKPSTTENTTVTKLGIENTTTELKPSSENITKTKPSSQNTKLSKPSSPTENTAEAQVGSNITTATKPSTNNTTKSEPSVGNTTELKTAAGNVTQNITSLKLSIKNTIIPKTNAENTTVLVKESITVTSNTVTEVTTQTEPVIQTEETASVTTTMEPTMTTTMDSADTTIMVVMTTIGMQSFNDTENRVASTNGDEDMTTMKTEEYTTVSHAETTLTPSTVVSVINQTSEVQKKTGISEPIRKIPSASELEAILNNTREKDEDYDEYDYNEPSLPPSLPNLRIIPFVAADAVVDDPEESVYTPSQDKMLPTDSPHFYDVSHSNRFSPPIETEGGFVPKEPILDGPFYESKYDAPYHTTGLNSLPLDITSGTILPPITEPPKLSGNEQCLSGGHHYRHGELLTEPTACDLCLCFYGEILCQEPKCPPVKPGCHRIRERERGSCCGKIICGVSNSESPTRVVDHVTPLTQTLQNSAPHLPAFTVADVIVTPDPFRDVIRTEPAPDLPSLIGEIMPYLWEHTTMPTLIVHTRTTTPRPVVTSSVPVKNTTHNQTTSTLNKIYHSTVNQVNDSTVKLIKHKNVTMNSDYKTELNILKKKDEVNKDNYEDNSDSDDNSDDNDNNNNDEDDSFSFDSVFHYLFSGEPLTKSPQVTTSRSDIKTKNITVMPDVKNKTQKINETEQTIEHRSEEDSNSVLDYINNTTSVPSLADKATSLEIYDKLEDLDLDTKNVNSIEKDTTTSQSSMPVRTTQKYIVKSTTGKHYTIKEQVTLTTSRTTTSVKPSHFPPLSVPDPGAVSGLLKLAGCNIYGRMYRVGRIISELSGPCLECMCTEVGVQCRPLKC